MTSTVCGIQDQYKAQYGRLTSGTQVTLIFWVSKLNGKNWKSFVFSRKQSRRCLANDHALSAKETIIEIIEIIDYLKTISAHEIPVIDCF